ncbi:MAG: DUF1127 domain-containing protein [Pseudomonadota bacterium]
MTFEAFSREVESRFTSVMRFAIGITNSFYQAATERFVEEDNREQIRQLLTLDDDQLRDMGVSAQDVKSAISLPIGQSSGQFLEAVRRRNKV